MITHTHTHTHTPLSPCCSLSNTVVIDRGTFSRRNAETEFRLAPCLPGGVKEKESCFRSFFFLSRDFVIPASLVDVYVDCRVSTLSMIHVETVGWNRNALHPSTRGKLTEEDILTV